MSFNAGFTGNLGRDPRMSYSPEGLAICHFSVGVNYFARKEKQSQWYNVTVFGNQAENCNKYLKKGSKVGVVTTKPIEIREREYEGKTYISMEVVAADVDFLTKLESETEEAEDNIDIPF